MNTIFLIFYSVETDENQTTDHDDVSNKIIQININNILIFCRNFEKYLKKTIILMNN